MTGARAFAAFYEYLRSQGRGDSGLRAEELEAAVAEILRRAKVMNLGEYLRSYKYKRRGLSVLQRALVHGERDPRHRAPGDVFRSSMELLGHSGQVDRICFDHGSRFFMSGGSDGMIKLWDVHSGFLVHSFIGHRNFVSDLCISSDGRVLVSCDSHGLLNVWSLADLRILFQLRLECEIIFTEFFDTGEPGYNLIVVLSRGVIKTYRLGAEGVTEESENLCLLDEAMKGLCFTDGGRFLLCSGWWPFLVVFDTQSPGGCMILETNGMPVNTICGAKSGLKIAAACDAQVFQWTFFTEGTPSMGNFKRRTKDTSLQGHWKRSITRVDIGENESVERICYLKDNFLVCICTDLRVRIFAGTELRCVIDVPEMGIAYPHPLENMFAFCGGSLRIYDMDRLVHEEALAFGINDAQFSNDGDVLVIGDERGVVRVLSMGFVPRAPREQFFLSDLDHLGSGEWGGPVECKAESTYSGGRERNQEWREVEYEVTEAASGCLAAEAQGAKHLAKDFIDLETFRRKYMNAPLPGEALGASLQTTVSDDSSTDRAGSTSSELSEESGYTSDEEPVEEAKGPLRRLLLESDESSEGSASAPKRSTGTGDSSGDLSSIGMSGRLRRFNRSRGEAGGEEVDGIRTLSLRSDGGGDAEEYGDGREACLDDEPGHAGSGLTQYVQSWLSSPSLAPQPGDVVYLSSEGLREFQMFDPRRKFKGAAVRSGYYEVRGLEAIRHDPPFLKVVLGDGGREFEIRYYRYPGWTPVLLLREQAAASVGDGVGFVANGIILQGRVSGERGAGLVVDSGGNSVVVDRSDILVPRMLFPEDVKAEILRALRQKRMCRGLYATLRRESNASYYGSVASTVNLGVIEEKVQHDLYRTVAGLEFDLDVAVGNSLHLGPVVHGHCEQAVNEIRSIVRSV